MAQNKGLKTEADKPHRILREVFRNFRQFRELVASTGTDVIEHGYWVYNEDGTKNHKVVLTISYSDLRGLPNILASRKKEAFYLNVIEDMKQRDVAEIMDITTVSVGQYVDAACEQMAKVYFAQGDNIRIEYESDQQSNGKN